MGADELLAAFALLRGRLPELLPAGVRAERDGPLVRTMGAPRGGLVEYRDLGGLEGVRLDELIARQIRVFAERGETFEWKSHGHDAPADLPQRLLAAGFVAEPQDTVLIAPAHAVAGEVKLPAGVAIRELTEAAEFEGVEALRAPIWGAGETPWLAHMLAGRRALDPSAFAVFAAEAGGEMVCAAWIRLESGTPFARLFGGATLPAWRSRGIYRAIVARRANLAVERGARYLHVDASDDSRPILERLGFTAITTTTPFRWRPPG